MAKKPSKKKKAPAKVQEPKGPRVCTFCEHVYMKPCDGKNESCGNLRWKKYGYGSLIRDEVVTTKPKKKKERVRLRPKDKPTTKSEAPRKKKKRVRL